MTLEEAILHAEEAASDYEDMIEDYYYDSEKLAKIRKQPEIIRCKDCENWDTTWQNDSAPNYHYCPMMDGTYSGDFYCAKAERRTDE